MNNNTKKILKKQSKGDTVCVCVTSLTQCSNIKSLFMDRTLCYMLCKYMYIYIYTVPKSSICIEIINVKTVLVLEDVPSVYC